jgi:hypothetical protein
VREVGAVTVPSRRAIRRLAAPLRAVAAAGLLAVVALAVAVAGAAAQLPPIGIRVDPAPGWREVPPERTGAAYVFRKAGADGKVVATFNVMIVESEKQDGSVVDPGVAEGLEAELLQVLPGAKVTDRALVDVGRFKAFRLTVEIAIDGKLKILRQTTVDIRRGVVTVTAAIDAPAAPALVPEVDAMVAGMAIDPGLP